MIKWIFLIIICCSCSAVREDHVEQPASMPSKENMCDYCYNERLKCMYNAETADDEYNCKTIWKQCVVDCYNLKRA